MKININFIAIVFLIATFSACIEEDLVVNGSETAVVRVDPVVFVNTPKISFVAGSESYLIDFTVSDPDGAASNVNVYKTYTDAATSASSNEALLGSYAVSNSGTTANLYQESITYDDLKADLTVNGGPLPADQVAIPVGSNWSLRIVPVDGSGNEVFSGSGISVAVLSPFAGNYTVIDSDYWRIGVQSGSANWVGEERFIGSVDATTFSHVDGWGPFNPSFGPAVGQFVFTVNGDNSITIPDDPSQLFFSGDDMLTCQEDSGLMPNVDCMDSNVLIPSADGKHIIKLTYGYFTTGSGAREFYEVLEKKVD